ncbi:26S proteasome subunit RPN7 domain-containing protein [Hirsutella rhossiliensis]|uniref:26S proteasome subunit RPN7 domain-containing protein n=1 Tax=Hirsutella rhossiliensis TaxID=111463 RepID=A0A9P8SGI9_9HYPO|nr:26S proteasome subunit RPN7 domain-containing protein [Hirsutella rhossiliensis]KAH0960021.1 26S proteasome subunit RPN7 domain-containing protein [Hirsutella rhossiliensis]
MAAPDSVAAFLAHASSHGGGTVVREQPKLDLDLYVQNYVGRTRFDRLLFIGKTCLPLCVDALKAAILEAKQGLDVARYKDAWDCIRQAAPQEPEAQRDDAWIDRTEAANKAETSRLEAELKGYKNNLIKESIRMGNEDLGRHFETIGKLQEALEAYGRMRQDVSTTKHIIDCGKHLAHVSLQRRDWTTALSTVGKTAGVQNSDDERSTYTFIKIVSGISHLGMGHYSDAAQSFLQADFVVSPSEYAHVASPNDVAIYGGLTALATMERRDLQLRVLENLAFRMFLEQEPHIRKAISLFINGRYSSCLAILESARPDYLLDIYLHKHIPDIYSKIRSKCIVQYFAPFSCVTIDSLDAAFGQTGRSVEPELVKMIRDGPLKARIDGKDKLLVAVRPDPRAKMQIEALDVARKYEREAKERLRRISLVAASLETVGANRKQTTGHASGLNTDESWYDEGRNLVQAGGAPSESQG